MSDINNLIINIKAKNVFMFLVAVVAMFCVMFSNLWYGIVGLVLVIAYELYANWEFNQNVKSGRYQFIYARCINVSEITGAGHAAAKIIGTVLRSAKREAMNVNYLFSASAADGADDVTFSIKAGGDGRSFSVGVTYLLCFDNRMEGKYDETNLLGCIQASQNPLYENPESEQQEAESPAFAQENNQ